MDWLFLGLVILGSVWGWTKESKELFKALSKYN